MASEAFNDAVDRAIQRKSPADIMSMKAAPRRRQYDGLARMTAKWATPQGLM